MFPGCLEWINLSNCLSSVDMLYTHTARLTYKQAGKQIHTHMTLHTYLLCPYSTYSLASHYRSSPHVLCFSLSHTKIHIFSYCTTLFSPFGDCHYRIVKYIDIAVSSRESTMSYIHLIEDRIIMIPCLQLYNCLAYFMWKKT